MRVWARATGAILVAIPVLAMAADSVTIAEGRWTETITRTSATLNGSPIPPDMLDEGVRTKTVCITAAEAADPGLYFKSQAIGGNCSAPTGNVGDGKLALAATCQAGENPPAIMEVAGTYAGTGYKADIRAKSELEAGEVLFEMTMVGTHEGACRGDEENAGPEPAGN